MKITISGVDFGKEKGGPFPVFRFRIHDSFFCFLERVVVEETRSKISWKVIANYHAWFSYERRPGQLFLHFRPTIDTAKVFLFETRRPFIYITEVFDVGNNEQTELG